MYQFLCIDANMPPPYLEIHWRDTENTVSSASCEEMDMDDMFERNDGEMHDEQDEADENWDNEEEDEDEDGEEDDKVPEILPSCGLENKQKKALPQPHQPTTNNTAVRKNNPTAISASNRGLGMIPRPSNTTEAMDDEENDGLDIQSLSVVEAEFIYNKVDEGKPPLSGSANVKRTINLEAFKIIRVIGKGNVNLKCAVKNRRFI